MKVTTQHVQHSFQDFTVFISKTPTGGKHDVHISNSVCEFVIRVTDDEIDSLAWMFNRAYTDIDNGRESNQDIAA